MNKIIKRSGYLLVPIAILSFVILLNWEAITYYTLRKVALFYAGRAHIAIEIGAIDGRPLTETRVENLSLQPADGQGQTYYFKTLAITCTYDLWDLRQGYEFFLQGLSCTADTPEFTYDLRAESPAAQPSEKPVQFLIPAVLPALEIHNGTVLLTHPGWAADLRGINSSLHSAAGVHQLQLDVADFIFKQGNITRIDTGFVAELHYKEEKLSVDSLKISEEQITATGFIDLAMLGRKRLDLAADIIFAESSLNLAATVDNQLLQMHVSAENFDINELQKRLGGAGWEVSGKIRSTSDLAVNLTTFDDLHGSFTADVLEGRLHGVNIESVSAAGSFDNESLKVSTAEARVSGNFLLIKNFIAPMPLLHSWDVLSIMRGSRGEFTADMADFAKLLALFKIDKDELPEIIRPESAAINGYLEDGVLHLENSRVVNADINLTVARASIPIPATKEAFESVPVDLGARIESGNLEGLVGLIGEIPLQGQAAADISINGSFREPQAKISLAGEYLGYEEMQLGELSLQGDVRLVQEKPGVMQSIDFEITALNQQNAAGTFALLTPVTGHWQGDTFTVTGTFLLDNRGEIAAGISRASGREIAVEVSTRDLDSDGWLGNFIDRRYFFHGADIEAVLLGLFENTRLQLSGTVSEVGGADVPLPLTGSFNLDYSPKGIDIIDFTWSSLERNTLSISGFLPYNPMVTEPFLDGELALKGHIDFPALEDIAYLLEPWGISKGSVALNMDVSGTWDQPEGHIHFQAESIEPPVTMRKYMDSALNFSGDIAALGGAIVLQAADLDSTAYSAHATGSWRHGISVKELLKNQKADLKGVISADAKFTFKDLNFLRQKLPWLRRLEGDMQGEIHIAGPIMKPSLQGSFSFKDGEASHTFNFPMLSALNLQGEFDEHSITLENLQAEVGGSPVNLNGRISRENEAVDVSLHVDGKNVLLFRNNDMRMRGDVQLEVSGPLQKLSVKGTTGLTGGYYTRNIDFLGMIGSSSSPVSEGVGFLFSFMEPPVKDAVLNIKITTIEPFRIRNNLIRGTLRPELLLKGTGELPFLVGTVYIDPSRVLLPSGRLQIQSGLLRFLEKEPDRPQLDLLAQSKILGYDINVVTRGPLDDPVITLSSSPSLPNDELLLLLLTGQPPKDDVAGGAKGSGTTNVMVYLGRDFMSKWLEDDSGASDETILDRFELDFGRNITKSGEQTVESTFRLSEYTSGTGKMYYLTGEKDKYDAYNYGLRLVFRFE